VVAYLTYYVRILQDGPKKAKNIIDQESPSLLSEQLESDTCGLCGTKCRDLGCDVLLSGKLLLSEYGYTITNDKTILSSVTVEAFTTSLLSTLTCFGPYRPSSEGTSIHR
jgi:hypothetical protein